MHKLFYLLLLTGFTAFSQTDSVSLANKFIKQYDLAIKPRPALEDINNCIATGEQLYQIKQDKTKLSLYLGMLYFSKAQNDRFQSVDKKQAYSKSKTYLENYVASSPDQDGTYRDAQSAILKIDSKLKTL